MEAACILEWVGGQGLTGPPGHGCRGKLQRPSTRLPPDCDTPPVQRQARLWPQGPLCQDQVRHQGQPLLVELEG
jgi:hypothetical protein